MSYLRISLSAFFLATSFSHIHAMSDAVEHYNSLDIEAVGSTLTLGELQFLANFCLMNHQYVLVDRAYTAALYQHLRTIHECYAQASSAPYNTSPTIALEQTYKNYAMMFGTRQLWQRRYQVYKQMLEEQHSAALDTAINTLFMYANEYIDRSLESSDPQLNIKLGAVDRLLHKTSDALDDLATNYGDVSDNIFPFEVQKHELYYTKMAYIEHLASKGLEQSYHIYEGNDFLIKELDRAKATFCELFLTWYCRIYQQLSMQTADVQYFTFMFNEENGTSEMYIAQLPQPPQAINS